MLDGEVVVLDPQGRSDFQALQNMLNSSEPRKLIYYVFDVPYASGFDLSRTPQIDRKEILRQLLSSQKSESLIRFSDHIRGQGSNVADHACQHALEGVVCKRVDAPYEQCRSRNWLKVKCLKRQEFVITGWTEPSGQRTAFGALLLGYYQDRELIYAGRVGTGFNQQSLTEIIDKLTQLEVDESAIVEPPKGAAARGVHWVEPKLVAEVEFSEWTNDGLLRHPSFKGLREDKLAMDITRESSASTLNPTKSKAGSERPITDTIGGIHITHPERVVYPGEGVTKRELAEYYDEIADWMLPYVSERPLTVVRCPQGRGKKCFFQKHSTDNLLDAIGSIEIEEDSGTAHYITIDDRAGLVALVQMGALEFHPWGSRNDKLDKPDMIIFDLDPDAELPWQRMIEAVEEVRSRLEEVGLTSFLRTSGGKGLHVVAPLTRRTDWRETKQFAKALADAMAADNPGAYVATSSKAKRTGKIFVDYLRNGQGATAIANYSTRARAHAPIATPLRWDELTPQLKSDQYSIRNIRPRLSSLKSDPWAGFFNLRQSITLSALKAVGLR